MSTLGNDVQGALRTLGRARAYAATVIAMIALGVAAGTILFTVYRGALLDPWPYEGGDRLVVFRGEYPAESRHPSLWSAADVVELRQFDAVFDHVIAGRARDVTLAGADGAERVRGAAAFCPDGSATRCRRHGAYERAHGEAPYSARSATSGSTRDARRAGT